MNDESPVELAFAELDLDVINDQTDGAWKHVVHDLAETLRDPEAAASSGVVKGKVTLTLDMAYVPAQDRYVLGVDIQVREPGRKRRIIPSTFRGGRLLVEIDDGRQVTIGDALRILAEEQQESP